LALVLVSFKGGKSELSLEKMHWNFIQPSTWMVIKRIFGMLKGRWRILLKRVDTLLRHDPNFITTCLSLHNLCIIHKENFNMQWVEEATCEVEHMKKKVFEILKETDVYHIVEQAIQDMKQLGNPKLQQECNLSYESNPKELTLESPSQGTSKKQKEEVEKELFQKSTISHLQIVRTLYQASLQRNYNLEFSSSNEKL